jgi:hypothetical protein
VGNFKGFSTGAAENLRVGLSSIYECISERARLRPAGHGLRSLLTTKLFAFENRKVLAHCKQVRQIYTVFIASATINRELVAIIGRRDPKKKPLNQRAAREGGRWMTIPGSAPGRRARRRVQRP